MKEFVKITRETYDSFKKMQSELEDYQSKEFAIMKKKYFLGCFYEFNSEQEASEELIKDIEKAKEKAIAERKEFRNMNVFQFLKWKINNR